MNAAHQEIRISVVVPSFNQARFLGATLDSIFDQEPKPHQVIVIDGASTDPTVEVLEEYAARFSALEWVSEPDGGPADAVNKGLARVTGDWIGIQSSDDIYYPGAFRRFVDCIKENPDSGLMYGDFDRIDEQGGFLRERRLPDFSWEAVFGISMSIIQSSVLFRADVARETGGWNADYYSCDLDYWLRMLFRTRAVHIPHVLSGWRCYEEQRTRRDTYRRIWDDYWRMIDESPDLAGASARIQKLAQASKHLRVLRSPPSPSRIFKLRHLLLGFMKHPGFWRYHAPAALLSWAPGFTYAQAVNRFIKEHLRSTRQGGGQAG